MGERKHSRSGARGLDPLAGAREPSWSDGGLEAELVLAEVARRMFEDAGEPAAIGRYRLLARLGGGGMGVVYAAYDPELDRKVALKVMRPTAGAGPGPRLIREAQAMASLSHPNVVAVHAVDVFGSRPFVAMEFVDGVTLSQWRDQATRSVSEIVAAFVQAAEGLAAAHRAGIVHRDFKPDNVMVDTAGRIRVLDFGLAVPDGRAGKRECGRPASGDRGCGFERITRTGALVGTPAYMSPEQFHGLPVDARSDQFSFFVALYEALYGERPFAGRGRLLAQAVVTGTRRPTPHRTAVPLRIRRAIAIGLQCDPAQRHADMHAVIACLSRSRSRVSKVGALVGVSAVAVVGVGLAQPVVRVPCPSASAKLEPVWGASRRDELTEALGGSVRNQARAVAQTTMTALDAWAADWAREWSMACEQREADRRRFDWRVQCLDARLGGFSGLVRALLDAAESPAKAVSSLPTASDCGGEPFIAREGPLPVPEAAADSVAQVRRTLELAEGRRLAGQYPRALALVDAAVENAGPLGYPPLVAEALLCRGSILAAMRRTEDARGALSEAYWVALGQQHVQVVAEAATALVSVERADPQAAEMWARHAESTILRLSDGASLTATLAGFRGMALADQGRYRDALPFVERAVQLQRAAHGTEHAAYEAALEDLGTVLAALERWDEAVAIGRDVLEFRASHFGEIHPQTATAMCNLAGSLMRTGSFEAAHELLQTCADTRQKLFGPWHEDLAVTFDGLGAVLRAQGRPRAALDYLERALAVRERVHAPGHVSLSRSYYNLGEVHLELGAIASALAAMRKSVDASERARGSAHPSLAGPLRGLGLALRAAGRSTEALRYLERALDLCETAEVGRFERAIVGRDAARKRSRSSAGDRDGPARNPCLRRVGRHVTRSGCRTRRRRAPARRTRPRALAMRSVASPRRDEVVAGVLDDADGLPEERPVVGCRDVGLEPVLAEQLGERCEARAGIGVDERQ